MRSQAGSLGDTLGLGDWEQRETVGGERKTERGLIWGVWVHGVGEGLGHAPSSAVASVTQCLLPRPGPPWAGAVLRSC